MHDMELAQQYALKVEWDRSSLGLSQIKGISYEQEKMTQMTDLRAQRLKKKKKKEPQGSKTWSRTGPKSINIFCPRLSQNREN